MKNSSSPKLRTLAFGCVLATGTPLWGVDVRVAETDQTPARPGAKNQWAYVKPVRPEPPPVKNNKWPRNPIDFFILARRLIEHGVSFVQMFHRNWDHHGANRDRNLVSG